MMTQTMNCRIPQRAPEVPCDPSETNGNDPLAQPLDTEGQSSGDHEAIARPEPTRGVKKVPSLRRGAAAYAQLLQSAVRASIEARKDEDDDDDDDTRGPPPLPDAMQVEASGSPSPSSRKRAFDEEMEGSYRGSACKISNRRPRDSEEMETEL
mmetsp:Transcript_112992/g.169045  ORF Transcript_112992/g.169045 Transcript_112992/m.169045 type:complete len:153 (-) Transcript_112992:256-714(-)